LLTEHVEVRPVASCKWDIASPEGDESQ
jgi:hypothetical protein